MIQERSFHRCTHIHTTTCTWIVFKVCWKQAGKCTVCPFWLATIDPFFFYLFQTGGEGLGCQSLLVILGMALFFFSFSILHCQAYHTKIQKASQAFCQNSSSVCLPWRQHNPLPGTIQISTGLTHFSVLGSRTPQICLTTHTPLKDVSLTCDLMLNAFVIHWKLSGSLFIRW